MNSFLPVWVNLIPKFLFKFQFQWKCFSMSHLYSVCVGGGFIRNLFYLSKLQHLCFSQSVKYTLSGKKLSKTCSGLRQIIRKWNFTSHFKTATISSILFKLTKTHFVSWLMWIGQQNNPILLVQKTYH